MAIWRSNQYVVGPLVLLIAGQWVLLFQGTTPTTERLREVDWGRSTLAGIAAHAFWDGISAGCIATTTKSYILEASFIYVICFDSIVFVLLAWELAYQNFRRSKLVDLVFKDGLMYVLIV